MKNLKQFTKSTLIQYINEVKTLQSNERIHITKTPIESTKIRVKYTDSGGKPGGLWYGFGSSWVDFADYRYVVTYDDKGDLILKDKKTGNDLYIYKIDLDMSDILVLDTEKLYIDFTNKYSTGDNYPQNIDWSLVEKDGYKGIEFPNYNELDRVQRLWDPYDRHMPRSHNPKLYRWIYNIDADSGCVWNGSAIKKITKL